MAAIAYMRNRRVLRRRREIRNRINPLEMFDDEKIYKKFRFHRATIYWLTDLIEHRLQPKVEKRGITLQPCLQVCVALRFYAIGTYQNAIGDMFGIDQSTVSRIVDRVTNALFEHWPDFIKMPSQREANLQKVIFFQMQGFPSVFGCIDGTHVKIQAPVMQEHEYVNRKQVHSINCQVVCDADLIFIDVVSKWPGSVHDAAILRHSPLFASMERHNRQLDGIILGDSAYMLRSWLMTPIRNPNGRKEQNYNFAQSSTRTTVERAIGVAKQRWRCLRNGLRLQPLKACRVIKVCFMLANLARKLKLPRVPPDSDDSESDSSSNSDDSEDEDDELGEIQANTERERTAAGQAVRDTIINQNF